MTRRSICKFQTARRSPSGANMTTGTSSSTTAPSAMSAANTSASTANRSFNRARASLVPCSGDQWPPGVFAPPFFSFSSLRKKRIAAPGEEKEREAPKPEVQTVPPSCNSSFARSHLPAPGHLTRSNYAPHAILMMAGKRLFTDTQHPVGADDSVRPQTSVLLCSSAER